MDKSSRGGRPDSVAEAVTTASVARGTRHTAAAQIVTQVVRFATNVALARLLSPDDFGVVAIALVVTLLLDQLKDLGTGLAIIQRETVDERLLNSVFYLNLALGVLLAGGIYASAGTVAGLLGNPDAAPVLQAFSGVTLVTSLAQIHHSLLRRDLRFYELAIVASSTAVVTAVVSIVAAFMGLNYWALVVGTIAGAVFGTVMVWIYDRWRPSLMFDLASLRSIWGFSFNLFLSNVLTLFFTQVDKVIISHFLGSAALGTYTLAQRTVTSPVTAVSTVVAEVTFPAFSRRQTEHAALRSGFVRSSAVVALVTFPVLFGFAALASPAVAVVFGARWSDMVPVIWLLAPVAAIQSVTAASSQILLAKGRSDVVYRLGIVYCVVLTAAGLIGVQWGLVGVAAALGAAILLITPFALMLAFREIELRLRDYLRAFIPHLWITSAMMLAVIAATFGVREAAGPAWLELVVGMGVGVAVFLLILLRVRPPAWDDALRTLRERRTS